MGSRQLAASTSSREREDTREAASTSVAPRFSPVEDRAVEDQQIEDRQGFSCCSISVTC